MRTGRGLASVLSWALAAVTASCADTSTVPATLSTHCGIVEIEHRGSWYERAGGALDDGHGNPPRGWDNPEQEGRVREAGEDRIVFTDQHGHEEVFVRTDRTEPAAQCD